MSPSLLVWSSRLLHSVAASSSSFDPMEELDELGDMSSMANTTSRIVDNDDEEEWTFDPRIFWSVNIVVILGAILACCWFQQKKFNGGMATNPQASDLEYQRSLVQREERRKQAKLLSPLQRKRLLMKSFRQNQVLMTVQETDLLPDPEAPTLEDNNDDDNDSDSLSSATGFLQLPTGRCVSNGCAICLGDYQVGEQVVWSSSSSSSTGETPCGHVFHLECLLDWMTKLNDPKLPCPCCRAPYLDWEQIRQEQKIKWSKENAFNPNLIRLSTQ